MAHDGSLASKVEDWIVTKVQAIQFEGGAAFNADDVTPWEGTEEASVGAFETELFSGQRDRIARVAWLRDRAEELSGNQAKVVATYLIMVGIRDFGPPGNARRGYTRDSTKFWGTNAIRNLVLAGVDQQRPNLDDGVRHTDKVHYVASELVVIKKNVCIMTVELTVDEVPKAS